MISRIPTTVLLALSLSPLAAAQVEDFEGGTNEGTWEFRHANGTPTNTMILAAGGNPGAYLDSGPIPNFSDFYPRAITTTASTVFHGDYRARNITQLSCDVKVDQNTFGVSLAMTLLLKNDGGTPFDLSDDCFVWRFYDNAPAAGAGWTSHVFDFDAQSATAPTGWQLGHLGAGITNCSTDADAVWNSVITDVTDVEIWYGTPITLALGLTQTLDVSIDNIAIAEDQSFTDACNGDGGDQMGCTNCPCGNDAPAGTIGGCINQSSLSARLLASGSVSVTAADPSDLRFDMTGGNPNTLAVLVSGDALAPQNMANPCFGLGSGVLSAQLDGLRCAVGNTLRHGGRPMDANGDVGLTNNGWGGASGPPAGLLVQAGFVAGQTRHFQVFYRADDTLGCQTGQNTSQAVTATFAP